MPLPSCCVTIGLSIVLLLALSGFAALNFVAYSNARHMTRFLPPDAMPVCPDSSSLWTRIRFLLLGPRIPRPVNETTPDEDGMPFEVQFTTTTDGFRLELWDIPLDSARGTVVMFHGYGGQKAAMLPDARLFRELGLNVVMADFRGSGGSDGDLTTIGVREAYDVQSTVAWAAERYPALPTVLFGVSMGAAAILRAARHHGLQPEALIMHCPFDRLLTTVTHRFEELGAPPFPAAQLLTFWGGRQLGFNGFDHNPADDARAVECPTLLLHASADPRVSVAEAHNVFDAIQGEKEIHIFDGLTHESYILARPDEYRSVVEAWIEKLLG